MCKNSREVERGQLICHLTGDVMLMFEKCGALDHKKVIKKKRKALHGIKD